MIQKKITDERDHSPQPSISPEEDIDKGPSE
jgi:hypothetical protein